jgi:putative membrane protein
MNSAAKVTIGILGGVLALLLLILALFAGGGMYGAGPMMGGFGDGGMMDGPMMGGWSGYGWLWIAFVALFWFGLLAVIVWTIARIFPARRRTGAGEPDAEEILRARLARGEIDAGEYERTLRILRGEKPEVSQNEVV